MKNPNIEKNDLFTIGGLRLLRYRWTYFQAFAYFRFCLPQAGAPFSHARKITRESQISHALHSKTECVPNRNIPVGFHFFFFLFSDMKKNKKQNKSCLYQSE